MSGLEPAGTAVPSADEWRSVVIVGAGGFGREVHEYARDMSGLAQGFRIKGFLDDNVAALDGLDAPAPLLADIDGYRVTSSDRFVVAIGDPAIRADVVAQLVRRGAHFVTIAHPTAFVASTASIGGGCVIGPFCAVGNGARVGDHAVMTWYSAVGHDASVGRFAVLSPYAVVNGGSMAGEGTFLGTRATINPQLTVGAWAKVAAGSVVYQAVPAGALAFGNPASTEPMGYDRREGYRSPPTVPSSPMVAR